MGRRTAERRSLGQTRLVFFTILVVVLAIAAVSLVLRILSENTVMQVFIACTVFSVGVVALDFLGILGGHHGDTASTAGHIDSNSLSHYGEMTAAHDTGAHADTGYDGVDTSHAAVAHGDAGQAIDGHVGAGQEAAGHDTAGDHVASSHTPHVQQNSAPVLSVLAYLRLLVYFCLGFGPSGVAAVVAGLGGLRALLIAAPVGLAALFLAQTFFRFQRHDTGALPESPELLLEQASVIVPLDHSNMGRVRVQQGLSVIEPYALAADEDASFQRGDTVRIIQVTDEYVLVR